MEKETITVIDSTLVLRLEKKLKQKQTEIKKLNNRISELDNAIRSGNNGNDYYRFVPASESEINVVERIKVGTTRKLDSKKLNDTIDKSINVVYNHTAEIIQTSDPFMESVLENLEEDMHGWSDDFYVRVMTFFNKKSLPLETENSNMDIHIIIRPTELGYENKTFIVSDFHNVSLDSLSRENYEMTLHFKHGGNPRKSEQIIIKPELVKFKK